MRRALIGLMAGLFAIGLQAQAEPQLLKVQSVATDAKLTADNLSFGMDGSELLFVADPAKVVDPKALLQRLTDTDNSGPSVTVWFDPETAQISRENQAVKVMVRSVEFEGKTIPGDQSTAARVPERDASPAKIAEFDLARGIAYAGGRSYDKALNLLDRALINPALPSDTRILGLITRTSLRQDMAVTNIEPSEARDRLLLGALEDALILRAAVPDYSGAAYGAAQELKALGAYDEALAVYQDALKRWPDNAPMTMRGIASVYRAMKQYDQALAWMDKLGALPDMKNNMPYRYHRAWILDLMGRHDEAVAELTEGLKVQSDYIGAFWRRSCAYAAGGYIQEAVADNDKAIVLQADEAKGAEPTKYVAAMTKRFAEVHQILKKALAKAPHEPVAGLCEGFWDWGDSYRARSPLLAPAGAKP